MSWQPMHTAPIAKDDDGEPQYILAADEDGVVEKVFWGDCAEGMGGDDPCNTWCIAHSLNDERGGWSTHLAVKWQPLPEA